MNLYLKVECVEGNPVVMSLSLNCNLLDDVERMYDDNKVDWSKIQGCLTEYFQSIGYAKIECVDDDGIVGFLKRLEQDVPLVKEYFTIIREDESENAMTDDKNEARI